MIAVLPYDVVDAEFSAALSSIVLVSRLPANALYILDPASGRDQEVPLPESPVAVAVDPAGGVAAVAFDAHVSFVDLTLGIVVRTCDLSSDAYDVTLSSAGTAYVVPRTAGRVGLHAVDRVTCSEASSSPGLSAPAHVALHPSGSAVFAADVGGSPSSIDRCDVADAGLACTDAEDSSNRRPYDSCGDLWVSSDGARIYTACGVTLRVPQPITGSLAYGGTLDGVSGIRHLSEAASAHRVVLVPDTDSVVRVHETDYLGLVAQYELPAFPASAAPAHGRFVFATAGLSTVYALVQDAAEAGGVGHFGVATLVP
jgi:DNA-binding beta-propeller fold protein YncE